MRVLLLAVMSATVAAAQMTTVAQTVVAPDNSSANGVAVIHATQTCGASAGSYLSQRNLTVKFLAGNFSVSVLPLDTCGVGAANYQVSWTVCPAVANATKQNPCPTGSDMRRWSETWAVPTSNTPVTIGAVVVPVGGAPCVTSSVVVGGKTWAALSGTWAGLTGTWAAQ